MQQVSHQQNSYHYQDDSQYTSKKDFDQVVQTYLNNLSSKKRDKALVNQQQYRLILKVLQEPKNTSISTAQFRFWVKKMFQLVVPPSSRHNNNNGEPIVYHNQKPVAIKERIYDILLWAHRQSHHGGRDKTSALVRRKFSWIPKELVARFVRYCPYCVTRRNGHLNMFPTFSPIPTPPHIHPLDPTTTTTTTTMTFCSPPSPLPPSLSSSPSSSSTTFYPGVNSCCIPSPSIYNNMDDHHLHHQQYHQNDPLLASPENHPSSEDLLYPLPKLSISSTATSVHSDPSSSSSPHPSHHLNFYMDSSSSHYYSSSPQQQHYNNNNNNNSNNNNLSITSIEEDSLGLNSSTRSSSISSTISSANYYSQQQSQQQFMYSPHSHYPFLSNETKPILPLNQPSSIYNNNNNNNHLPIPDSPSYPQHESKQMLMNFVQQHHPSLNGMSFV